MSGWLTSPHDAAIAAIALPNLASELLEPVLSTIETAAAGRLGTITLAALGIAEEAHRLLTFGRHALSVSATPMVAAAVAAGDTERAAGVVCNGCVLAIGCGVVQLVVIRLWGRAVVRYMTPKATGRSEAEDKAAAELTERATRYLRIVGTSRPAFSSAPSYDRLMTGAVRQGWAPRLSSSATCSWAACRELWIRRRPSPSKPSAPPFGRAWCPSSRGRRRGGSTAWPGRRCARLGCRRCC